MTNLKHWQEKIKEKRKQTSFRDFMKEVASWQPFIFHKNSWYISRFPDSDRIWGIIKMDDFYEKNTEVYYNGLDFHEWDNFFEKFSELMKSVHMPHMINFFGSENSDYADVVNRSKSAYLSAIVIYECENILYSISVKDFSTNVFNSMMINVNNENIYQSTWILESFNIYYSRYIRNSNNIWFSTNLIGCIECIDCNDLENAQYHIGNKKYEKEEYKKKKAQILKDKQYFLTKYKKLPMNWKSVDSRNVTGNFMTSSHDVENGYFVNNVSKWKNLFFTWGIHGNENMYDIFNGGAPSCDDIYGVNGVWNGSENVYIWANLPNCNNVYYSFYLESCSFCIWCIGLKNKQYCIFNKQYTKEEWEKITNQIFSQMDQDWILWDFFPGSINPFYFNDTMAGILWNFKQEEIEWDNYMWREWEIRVDIPEGADVIKINELHEYQWYDEEGNWKISKDILKKVIKDENGNYYRIVQMEYDFLLKHNLPLPEIHWLDRMKLNFWV